MDGWSENIPFSTTKCADANPSRFGLPKYEKVQYATDTGKVYQLLTDVIHCKVCGRQRGRADVEQKEAPVRTLAPLQVCIVGDEHSGLSVSSCRCDTGAK
jgi:hypothetical protein